jgi:hypothetical protein
MKRVLPNYITANAKQPFVKATFEQYEGAFFQISSIMSSTFFGQNDQGPVLLYGCKSNYSGGVFTIGAGAIYFDGELFYVKPFSLTTGSIPTLYPAGAATYSSSDPILFSDGNTHNVHLNNDLTWSTTMGAIEVDYNTIYNSLNVCRGWQTHTLTVSDLTPQTGTVSLTNATKKELNYLVNFQTKTIDIDINLQGVEFSSNNIAYLDVNWTDLNVGISVVRTNEFMSTGQFINTGNQSTYNAPMVIKALTGNHTIRLSKFNATDFDTVGTDNCGFRGQITINLD